MSDNQISAQFNDAERAALLAVKGVGPTVIIRLEELGIATFTDLASRSVDDICAAVASSLGSTCWKNSPQSRAAIQAAIIRANAG